MVAENPAFPQGPDLRDRLLGGFRDHVPPLRPTPAYRLALVAVAFAMVLLPLLYVGLIAGVAWSLWAYSQVALTLMQELRGSTLSLLCFLPFFAGGVVLVCLVKPLFARAVRANQPVKLDAREEPLLFEFVACLCQVLGAPVPKEIHVDCQVNASASFRRGLLSLFGDDLVLTIGLPLAAGLSAQQLAGVMAHELGHFSQKLGLRVSVVIRVINFWFARLVFQRDRFDAALAGAAKRAPSRVRWIFHLILFVVVLTRRALWAVMMLGHVLSSFMMRQMEYDADRYEVRLAGFHSFDSSMREIFALSAAYQMAMKNLEEQWKERRLVDKFPRLVVANRQEGVRQLAAQLEHFMANEQEELFGTHPTSRQRVARALREKGLGVFSSDLPASALFSRFDELERTVSLAFYREMVGNQVRPQDLIAVDEIKQREAQAESDQAALERYFQNPNFLRALPLPPRLPTIKAEPPAIVAELEKSRQAVLAKDAGHTREIENYRQAVDERILALRALAVIRAGFLIRPGSFGQEDGSPVAVERAADRAAERMRNTGDLLERYENVEVRRLLLALILLDAPQTGGRVPEPAARRDEIARYLACAVALKDAFPRLFELRETRTELEILVQQIKPKTEDPRLFAALRERLGTLQDRLKEVHRIVRPQAYPFDHAKSDTTLAQYAIPSMPAGDDFQGLMTASELALTRLHEVYDRLLGRLASIAELVETALGLPPLTSSSAAGAGSFHASADPAPFQAASPAPAELAAAHSQAASPALSAASAAPAHPAPAGAGPIPETKAEAVASREAYALFFRSPLDWRALPLPGHLPDLPPDPRRRVGELREVRLAAAQAQEEHGRMVRIYQAAERKLIHAWRAESLVEAGFSIDPASFEVPGGDAASLTRAQERALLEMKSCEAGIQPFDEHQARRLIHALTLLGEERIAFRVAEADRRRRETPALLACAAALHSRFPAFRELRKKHCILEILGMQQNGQHAKDPGLRDTIAQHMAAAHKLLQELQRDLHRDPSPFASVRGAAASLGQIAVPSLPADRDYNGIFTTAGRSLKDLSDLHRRVLGRLIGTAEAVEQALGFGG